MARFRSESRFCSAWRVSDSVLILESIDIVLERKGGSSERGPPSIRGRGELDTRLLQQRGPPARGRAEKKVFDVYDEKFYQH